MPHGKNAKELAKTVKRMLMAYTRNVHTITGDNGTEFAEHEDIAKALNAQFFFTHPYSSWEKGLIENTNKLIRQYIPKKTNFNTLTEQQIKDIQYKINSRPRKKLNFYSTKEFFFLLLQQHSCIQLLNLPIIDFFFQKFVISKNVITFVDFIFNQIINLN